MSDTGMTETGGTPPGWYYAQGDPPGTERYWDGAQWQGAPRLPGAADPGAVGFHGQPLASPGKRIGGRLLDFMVFLVVAVILGVFFGRSDIGLGFGGFVPNAIAGIIYFGYESVMVMTRGATAGKLALGMRVIPESGAPMDSATAFRRAGLLLLNMIPLLNLVLWLIGLISLILLFADPKRQTAWDKIGGTVVVDA